MFWIAGKKSGHAKRVERGTYRTNFLSFCLSPVFFFLVEGIGKHFIPIVIFYH